MGIDASSNIKIKQQQQEKDSPFLTLSERNKKGLSSQNIFGGEEKAGQAQEPKRTERIAQLNIFGAEEGGQVKDDTSVFGQQEEKSCDEYFQENAQGEMNFDTNGFYGDAIGVSFGNSNASNPISGGGTKAGSSQTKDLETELKLMLRDPEKNQSQIDDLKKQIEATGGNADQMIADGLKKAEEQKGAKSATKTGSSANGSTTVNNGTPKTGSTEGEIGGNAANALNNSGSVSDLMAYSKQAGLGADVEIVAGRGSSSSSSSSSTSSSSSSESGGIMDSIKNAFSPSNLVSQAANGVTSAVTGAIMNPITETFIGNPIKGLISLTGLCENPYNKGDKGGEDLDAGKAKGADTADKAKKLEEKGQKKEIEATGKKAEAKTDGDKAKAGASDAKQKSAQADAAAKKYETTEAQQTDQTEWQKHEEAIQKATAEEKAALKEAKQAEGKQLQGNIDTLNGEISALQSQLSSITGTDSEASSQKAQIQSKIATKKAELAEKQAQLAKCQQEESLATTDEAEAQQLSQQAAENAAAAEQSATEAGQAAKSAIKEANTYDADEMQFQAERDNCLNAEQQADAVAKKAKVFKEAAAERYGKLHYGRQ